MNASAKPVLVIGGGIAGMTAAVEAAEVGCSVILVEKEAFLGGRVLRSFKYFPKMCPPTCGLEINVRRIRQNKRITVHTLAEVDQITGSAGAFRARIVVRPRYVTGMASIDDDTLKELSSERADSFNLGVGTTKALYLPSDTAYPPIHVLDREALSEADAAKLEELCPPGAIDLSMAEEVREVEVGAIIVATGWRPYDASRLEHLGGGVLPNVVNNVMMERLAAFGGPTGGEITRPSDGARPENIAFVQCAGSRDEDHLPYCSAVCCMAALKQARYLRAQSETAKVTIFYIDIRTIGRLEKFYYDLLEDENVTCIKGKVAQVSEDADTGNLLLKVEDTISGETLTESFDLVVLSTGIVPTTADEKIPFELQYDAYGFIDGSTDVPGIYAAGCVETPCDVSRATKASTAAVMKAIQCLNGGDE